MDSDLRSPRAVWRRAFVCSICALIVEIVLACILDDLAYMAAYEPRTVLPVLVILIGFPLFLSALRVLGPGGIRSRMIGKWLKDPISWSGVVGVTLYVSTIYTSVWIMRTIGLRPTEGLVLWGAVPVCYLGTLVFFYVVTSWAAARSRGRDSWPTE